MTFIEFISHPAFIWPVSIIFGTGIILLFASYYVASYIVYVKTLKRSSKDKWTRDVPSDLNQNSVDMYNAGAEWAKENLDKKRDVHIVHDGLNLYGEFYDFGAKTCAVILSGRTECLKYGYYFAIPYAKNGCNILVLDPRAHGLSDGVYNTVGFEESGDIIAWSNFLVNELKQEGIVYHGICIGAAGGMLAITNEKCPKEVKAIITEGMFPNFNESMKNNLRHLKKPVFIHKQINKYMIKYTGHSMMVGPINYIDKLDRPLLMLHSREDHSSKPEFAQKLFDLAGTKDKEIVWFEKGRHSFLRITDTAGYDGAIANFLKKHNLV